MIIQTPKIIRNFDAWHDGISYAGLCSKAKMPSVKIQTKGHRAAGMDGNRPVDMGIEDMTCEMTFAEWMPKLIKLIGTEDRITLRPAAKLKDHSAIGWAATIGGLWTQFDPEGLGAGEESPMKIAAEVHYYRLEREGEFIFEIDVDRGIRKVGDVDQLAELRRAMGH